MVVGRENEIKVGKLMCEFMFQLTLNLNVMVAYVKTHSGKEGDS